MSCGHAAASSRSASAPRTGARPRARAATPSTCAQWRGRDSRRSARARGSAQEASVFIRPRLDSLGGTFTDVACRLKTSCKSGTNHVAKCARRFPLAVFAGPSPTGRFCRHLVIHSNDNARASAQACKSDAQVNQLTNWPSASLTAHMAVVLVLLGPGSKITEGGDRQYGGLGCGSAECWPGSRGPHAPLRPPRRMCPGRGSRCRSMLVLAQDAATTAAEIRNFRPVKSPAGHLGCMGSRRSKPSPRTNGPEDPGLG